MKRKSISTLAINSLHERKAKFAFEYESWKDDKKILIDRYIKDARRLYYLFNSDVNEEKTSSSGLRQPLDALICMDEYIEGWELAQRGKDKKIEYVKEEFHQPIALPDGYVFSKNFFESKPGKSLVKGYADFLFYKFIESKEGLENTNQNPGLDKSILLEFIKPKFVDFLIDIMDVANIINDKKANIKQTRTSSLSALITFLKSKTGEKFLKNTDTTSTALVSYFNRYLGLALKRHNPRNNSIPYNEALQAIENHFYVNKRKIIK